MLKKLCDRRLTPAKRRPIVKKSTTRLRLEWLEVRVLCDADSWAPVAGSSRWDSDLNWSLHRQPAAGDDLNFNDASSKALCMLASGIVLPNFKSITFGDWSGALYTSSTLTADTITLLARTNTATHELVLGASLKANTALNIQGGSVYGGGPGTLEGDGTITVNGTSATDLPTLGAPLSVGSADGTKPAVMNFDEGSQPLVVTGQGVNITVNPGSNLHFWNQPLAGNTTATAVSNGDSQAHSIILNSADLYRINSCPCFVGMGLIVNGGSELTVNHPLGLPDGGPLHFTGSNQDGYGLDVATGAAVTLDAGLAVDNGAWITGGTTTLDPSVPLTLGVAAGSRPSVLNAGVFALGGSLTAHGGFDLYGGLLGTFGSQVSAITVDAGNQVWMDGGEIDVTYLGDAMGATAVGKLTIYGWFYATAGKIVNNMDTRNGGHIGGTFLVNGNVNFTSDVIFSSQDLNPNPGNVNWRWSLISWTGTRSGSATVSLPANWTYTWNDAFGRLDAFEP